MHKCFFSLTFIRENWSSEFPNSSETNQPVQSQMKRGSLKFQVFKKDGAIRVGKTKRLISFTVTAQLSSVFVFAHAKILFPYDAADKVVHW